VSGPVTARHRVRHFETDAQGVVFNMWYLAYCDEACADFLEDIGVGYESLVGGGWDFQVVHADLDWSSPLRARETADFAITCDHIGRTSFTLRSEITCEGRPVAVVRLVYVGMATDGSGTMPVPEKLRVRLKEHRTTGEAIA
jgi:acyl-CoA thioester hydrolase